MSREIGLTFGALALTCMAAVFGLADILTVLVELAERHEWTATLGHAGFALIVTYLVYGACVYHLARLGHLRRSAETRPLAVESLARVYREPNPPLLTVLVPSFMEDERVIRRTLLSAALQEYPRRRVVLLIDDAPVPRTPQDGERLRAARELPRFVESMLEDPRKRCEAAFAAFLDRRHRGQAHVAAESVRLAECQAQLASWFDEQADAYEVEDHADALFVDLTLRARAQAHRGAARRGDVTKARRRAALAAIAAEYRRLIACFDVEIVAFERKRYANLSHEPNKAMNLNSYIGLLGGQFREVRRADGSVLLEPTDRASADLVIPPSEFLLIVDADSVVTPDYALRLVHVMRSPGHERVAVIQTPYSAFPGAPGAVERIAGATTDIQRLIHQGFARYGATYWVGANAIVRTSALRDIATTKIERGYEVPTFIHDRTVIEDTESTVELLNRGWRLYNYPDTLAYSETPPDFGSLLIQRRRWANGGLLILPKLLGYLRSTAGAPGRALQALMMTSYLTSLTAVTVGLLLVLTLSFEESIRGPWLPLAAVPYYVLYARDLRLIGYRLADIVRVYALNLVLIPVNLIGVLASLQQALTGRKSAFGRTPKVQGRTSVPGAYLMMEYGLLLLWIVALVRDVRAGHLSHMLFTAANIGLLVYGLVTFIGIRQSLEDSLAAILGTRETVRRPLAARV
jgi:cellulose synthase/poly-beta-1,6-N-acetylglucosamine synthase-like glycosyltransferase